MIVRHLLKSNTTNQFKRLSICSSHVATVSTNLSFSTQSSGDNDKDNGASDIIQGPSLLVQTGNLNRPSPSLFYLPGLRSLPFWTAPNNPSQSSNKIAFNDSKVSQVVSLLEKNYETILEENQSAVMGFNSTTTSQSKRTYLEPDYDVNKKKNDEHSGSLHDGKWDWHSYILNGEMQPKFAEACPKTSSILNELLEKDLLFFHNPFAFSFFSTLHPKSKIQAHTGPMNLRLRIHLPLITPTNNKSNSSAGDIDKIGIRCGTQKREWIPGKALVLDDSFNHEVWNDTDEPRVLLLVDMWHPDITREEKTRISKMFDYAKNKGWVGSK